MKAPRLLPRPHYFNSNGCIASLYIKTLWVWIVHTKTWLEDLKWKKAQGRQITASIELTLSFRYGCVANRRFNTFLQYWCVWNIETFGFSPFVIFNFFFDLLCVFYVFFSGAYLTPTPLLQNRANTCPWLIITFLKIVKQSDQS